MVGVFYWNQLKYNSYGGIESILEYNTVVENILKPINVGLREKTNDFKNLKLDYYVDEFVSLIETDFKFMNYARSSVTCNEKVISFIYQPVIKTKVYKFFNKVISMPHIHILTDKELILIKEDKTLYNKQQREYGAVWTYIPLNNIADVSCESSLQYDTEDLCIHIPNCSNIISTFHSNNKKDLNIFITDILQTKNNWIIQSYEKHSIAL